MSTASDANAPRILTTIISRKVVKRCPHKDETDIGTLTIGFDGPAPELHELAELIDGICASPITHEAFTAAVAELAGPTATVSSDWRTGPWSVEVAAH